MSATSYKGITTTTPTQLKSLFKQPVIVAPKISFKGETNSPIETNSVVNTKEVSSLKSSINWQSIIKKVDFEVLTNKLLNYEKKFGFSTIEMFEKYNTSIGGEVDEFEEWIDTYILYLGLSEVRKYSCP